MPLLRTSHGVALAADDEDLAAFALALVDAPLLVVVPAHGCGFPNGFVVVLGYEFPGFVLVSEAEYLDGLALAIFVPAIAAEAGNGAGDVGGSAVSCISCGR